MVGNLRAPIHDELVFSIPADRVEDFKVEIVKAMESEYLGALVTAGFEGQGETWVRSTVLDRRRPCSPVTLGDAPRRPRAL